MDEKKPVAQPEAPRSDPALDPDAPISEEELREASSLRDALEDPDRPHEGAEVARALAQAHAPRPLEPGEHDRIVAQALTQFDGARRRRRGVVIRVSFGVASVLAVAAAALFFIGRSPQGTTPAGQALLHVRSTQPLFHEPFERGNTSARVDTIALARASDLRENQFVRWGVK